MSQKILFCFLLAISHTLTYSAKLPEYMRQYPSHIQKTRLNHFIQNLIHKHQFTEKEIRKLFDQVKWKPKPKPTKKTTTTKTPALISWTKYKKAYITNSRVDQGILFYLENKKLLQTIAKQYNVPELIILSIMGIETNYGNYQGKQTVLNTLANQSFNNYYRRNFFVNELKNFLILAKKFNLNTPTIIGSSAGAFGMSQFMPSSYLDFAQDHDQDGKADIINNKADALASIAYYFKKHGWQPNAPIAHNLPDKPNYYPLSVNSAKQKPKHRVGYLRTLIKEIPTDIKDNTKATIIRLPEKQNNDYWITYNNFYVITRYNHSLRYAMAVYQLASAIKRGIGGAKQHTVQKGDTMTKIAKHFNTSTGKILTLNPTIENLHRIYIGQKIWIIQ